VRGERAHTFATWKTADMAHLWTIIFVLLLAIGFGLAARHDLEVERRRRRKETAYEKRKPREK
jgi:hypothetical protein